jgi:AAA domain
LSDQLYLVEIELSDSEKEYNQISDIIRNFQSQEKAISDSLNSLEAEYIDIQNCLDLIAVTDFDWWKQSRDVIQSSVPWIDEELNRLRSELFALSMEVHEIFIRNARFPIMKNISRWIDVVSGFSKDLTSTEIWSLWQTFFLIVPVVSTTFASIQRLFGRVENESIGWLFVDEAGQSTAQSPVGALLRSKRAVMVGDPLQIEPISNQNESVVKGLQKYFDIDDVWNPIETSAQKLGDRANSYGTYIKYSDQSLWVGCPLWVHRRCIDPMLTISNIIAYDNKMIMKTLPAEAKKLFPLGESGWIDINGTCKGRHWVPTQGDAVISMLQTVVQSEEWLPDLYIVSPFRAVSSQMKNLLWSKRSEWASQFLNTAIHLQQSKHGDDATDISKSLVERSIREWINKSVGTVHTFQGKEADTVILLLGTDDKSQAAAEWAASKPNILNVAVTRAKYRFYIVGSKRLWAHLKYFKDVIKLLDKKD